MGETDTHGGDRRRGLMWAAVAAVAALAVGGAVVLWQGVSAEAPASAPTPTATNTVAGSPTPTPTPTGAPADTAVYDVEALPTIDVFAVIPALPVDDDPTGSFTGEAARAVSVAPVFPAPGEAPVAALARDVAFDGTTVPIVERQEHWVKVLLVGRQAIPSAGDPGQLTGWLRVADVELFSLDAVVEVSISARTVDIVRGDSRERVASDFAWGSDATPTPRGRSFVMTTDIVPEFGYTRGNPLIYLSVQSPTLDGFGGADVAVTAFHYHDARSGPISNGCIRVDAGATQVLAALPLGTPVVISD